MKTFGKILLLVISGVAFYWSIGFMFSNYRLALVVTLSVALHEIGHAVAMLIFGHRKISMFFVPFLGAAVSMDSERVKDMRHLEQAVIALAGPAMNCIIIIGSLYFIGYDEWHSDALLTMSVNASLAVFNLLPFGFIDGGRFVKALFNSTNEEYDKVISALVSVMAILIGLTLVFWSGKFNLIYLLVYFGFRREADLDDPNAHFSAQAMSMTQVKVVLGLYLLMLVGTWLLNYFLPSWNQIY